MDGMREPLPPMTDLAGAPTGGTADRGTAGRELDAEIAEKVTGGAWAENQGMRGHKWLELPSGLVVAELWRGSLTVWDECPRYSTDIAAAWTVVEKMQDFSCDFELERAGSEWYANFKTGAESASTAALAICLAALDAVAARPAADTPAEQERP